MFKPFFMFPDVNTSCDIIGYYRILIGRCIHREQLITHNITLLQHTLVMIFMILIILFMILIMFTIYHNNIEILYNSLSLHTHARMHTHIQC